ncbi:MAG: tyrosine-type recombinase/integrase [Thermoplasmatales archaeon]|nr:MAG: tyrosine-type recombinase/integrase [Thermoplasmatales archaeon]
MKGCRALSNDEIRKMLKSFSGANKLRDLAFFLIGIFTGFRAQEILSLRIKDIWEYGCVKDQIEVKRQNTKGKRASRQVYLHKYARVAIKRLIKHYEAIYGEVNPEWPLFLSKEGNFKSVCYVTMYLIVKAVKLSGKIACHSLRKTFCRMFLERTNDNVLGLMRIIGHSSPTVTLSYCTFRDQVYQEAVLSFSQGWDNYIHNPLF